MPRRSTVQIGRGAKADLRHIRGYLIDQAGRDVANNITRKILDLVEKLEQFPERGPIPDEVQLLGFDNIRQLSLRPYRVIYQVAPGKVTILMIVDGRRDLQPLLRRRLFNR